MNARPYAYLSRRADGLCAVMLGGSMACDYTDRREAEAIYAISKRAADPDKPWVWCSVAAEAAFRRGADGDDLHGWVEQP